MAFGAWEYAVLTVIIFGNEIVWILLVSKVPFGKITDNVGDSATEGIFVFAKSSIVITVVVASFIRPPLLVPAFTGSDISIIWEGLIKLPAAIVVVKEQVSPLFCSLYKNHLPNLLAWFLEVVPKAAIFFMFTPYLFWVAASASIVSISVSCVVISK